MIQPKKFSAIFFSVGLLFSISPARANITDQAKAVAVVLSKWTGGIGGLYAIYRMSTAGWYSVQVRRGKRLHVAEDVRQATRENTDAIKALTDQVNGHEESIEAVQKHLAAINPTLDKFEAELRGVNSQLADIQSQLNAGSGEGGSGY